jgi:PAS domain S-box-containing protein
VAPESAASPAAPPIDVATVATASFVRRVGERGRPEDVAALVVEDCLTDFGARRALFAGVDAVDGALVARFTIGFDRATGSRASLASDDLPVVAAALRGQPVPLEGAALAACGILGADAFGEAPPASGLIVPLVALPIVGNGRGELQPRCRLFNLEHSRRERCFLQKRFQGDPQVPEPWELRIRTVCPECTVFGSTGVVLLERERPFAPDEVQRLAQLGVIAGQRMRALESIERLERAADKLRKEREWLDTVMVSAADPIVVTDSANALVLQNRRAEELLVSTNTDSIGKRRAIGINDITFSAYLSSVGIDAKRAPRELPLVNPIEGSDLLFEAISSPAISASGQRIGMVTVLRDITDLQKATQELYQQVYKAQKAEFTIRQERDRLNLIVRSAVEPIVVTNQSNDIVLTNGEGEKLFQAQSAHSEARRKAVRNNDAFFSSYLTEFMADPELQSKRELRLVDPETEEVRAFEVTSGKVRGERGQPVAVVSVFHDVTKLQELERRRVEQKLFESEKLAATGRLAASIAHELNNPLESIKNSLYLLQARFEPGDQAEKFLEIARKESERVSNIVKQFLGLYRPQAATVPFNPASIIDDEVRLVENQLQKRKIKLERNLQKTPSVMGSEDQMKQVFLNLILNAIEAMPKGGTLYVSARVEREPTPLSAIAPAVHVTIGDTGTGIQSEHMRYIFEPFFTTKTEKGTGLGLWVSYGIVKAHKGEIKVETTPGTGTQFHVILPVRADAEGPTGNVAGA